MRFRERVGGSTTAIGSGPRALATSSALALLLLGAGCSDGTVAPDGGRRATSSSSGAGAGGGSGLPSGAGTGGAPSGTGGVGTGAGSGDTSSPGAGAPPSGSGGSSATAGQTALGGAGGLSTSGAAGLPASGSGGEMPLPLPMPTNSDHCLFGYDPLPSDATMAYGPAIFTPSGGGLSDTILQPEVLQWMTDNKWTGAHVVWHAVRGCTDGTAAGLLNPLGFPDVCRDYPVLIPTDQNCKTAGDGYQFLLFHRHMLQALKQLWPQHAADFAGFPKFPTTKEELPEVWNTADPEWSQQILDAAAIGDNIEQNLDKFADEGTLGFWLQCPNGSKLASAMSMPYVGLHFDLHNQWSRGSASEHGLNNGQVNITNYMFWKLHGWIDNVWEKYRVAKGLTTDDAAMQKYKQDLTASCNEMDIEIEILKQNPGSGPVLDCPPDVDEKGDFHTKVRPIFETETNHCASCHGPSQTSPYAGLTLGGQVSSKCIVERLKRQSHDGGQLQLVLPGDPDHSYLYLKPAGLAAGAGCVSTDPDRPCNTAPMPPGGKKTMTDEQLQTIRQWILDGANYP